MLMTEAEGHSTDSSLEVRAVSSLTQWTNYRGVLVPGTTKRPALGLHLASLPGNPHLRQWTAYVPLDQCVSSSWIDLASCVLCSWFPRPSPAGEYLSQGPHKGRTGAFHLVPYPRLKPNPEGVSASETAGEVSLWNSGQDDSGIGRTKQKQHVTVLLRICKRARG